MTATINITGLGRVYARTSASTVGLAGAIAIDGTPVNVSRHAVSRARLHQPAADRNDSDGYFLREVRPGTFVLDRLPR